MDLVLWRHADAVDVADPVEDLDRPLTSKGERQAERMGQWLSLQLPASVRLLASPARRAQQTAAALDRRCRTVPTLGPTGSVEALLEAARWPDAREPVVVVGHQPTLGMTAAYLMSGQAQHWALRKGGILWLRLRSRPGVSAVVLHAALGPDLI